MKLLKYVFFLVPAFLIAYLCLVSTAQAADIRQDTVFQAVNAERAAQSLKPLKQNQELAKAAQAKADDMVKLSYFAHRSPQGKNVWSFIFKTKALPTVAGENLAKGFKTTESTVTAWMNSPSHRANILDRGYTDAGIGVATGSVNGKSVVYVVQVFGEFTQ